jgi:hypothetical protein
MISSPLPCDTTYLQASCHGRAVQLTGKAGLAGKMCHQLMTLMDVALEELLLHGIIGCGECGIFSRSFLSLP